MHALFYCSVYLWSFSTAWYDSTRDGSERYGSAWFAFPLQFSTALEWAGLFIFCYSSTASTAVTPEKLLHSASLHHALAGSAPSLSTRGQSVLPQQTMKQPCFSLFKKLIRNSCVRSFAGCAVQQFNKAASDDSLRPVSDQQSLHVTFW